MHKLLCVHIMHIQEPCWARTMESDGVAGGTLECEELSVGECGGDFEKIEMERE